MERGRKITDKQINLSTRNPAEWLIGIEFPLAFAQPVEYYFYIFIDAGTPRSTSGERPP
jgi:hypothetical protein